jgi:hypothetical protein
MPKRVSSANRELAAINGILDAREGLDGEAIQRVLDYVFGPLSIPTSSSTPNACLNLMNSE